MKEMVYRLQASVCLARVKSRYWLFLLMFNQILGET